MKRIEITRPASYNSFHFEQLNEKQAGVVANQHNNNNKAIPTFLSYHWHISVHFRNGCAAGLLSHSLCPAARTVLLLTFCVRLGAVFCLKSHSADRVTSMNERCKRISWKTDFRSSSTIFLVFNVSAYNLNATKDRKYVPWAALSPCLPVFYSSCFAVIPHRRCLFHILTSSNSWFSSLLIIQVKDEANGKKIESFFTWHFEVNLQWFFSCSIYRCKISRIWKFFFFICFLCFFYVTFVVRRPLLSNSELINVRPCQYEYDAMTVRGNLFPNVDFKSDCMRPKQN